MATKPPTSYIVNQSSLGAAQFWIIPISYPHQIESTRMEIDILNQKEPLTNRDTLPIGPARRQEKAIM